MIDRTPRRVATERIVKGAGQMSFVSLLTSEIRSSLRDEDIIVVMLPALKDRAKLIRSLRDEESAHQALVGQSRFNSQLPASLNFWEYVAH